MEVSPPATRRATEGDRNATQDTMNNAIQAIEALIARAALQKTRKTRGNM
jgi:hypothetical protein